MTVDLPVWPEGQPVRHRRQADQGRRRGVYVRLSAEEFAAVGQAAWAARLTPAGYAGEVVLAAAHADAVAARSGTRLELAAVQRELFAVRTALIAAASVLDTDGLSAAVAHLDKVVGRVHAVLKQS